MKVSIIFPSQFDGISEEDMIYYKMEYGIHYLNEDGTVNIRLDLLTKEQRQKFDDLLIFFVRFNFIQN